MALSKGSQLNQRYTIVQQLGEGGYGAVYQAWDMALGQACAVKENLTTDDAGVQQFRQEAQILAGLKHPHLPRVIDYFVDPMRGQYLVMDYIKGVSLERLISEDHQLPVSDITAWALQILDALAYLHAQTPPVIHRDIKPANILIDDQDRAILVDFGVAKHYEERVKTSTGARGVTDGYSPWEQYAEGLTDARSDLYALGATLYHALAGRRPQQGVERLKSDRLLPVRAFNVNVPDRLSLVLRTAIAVQPEDRFPTAAAFAQALTGQPPANGGGASRRPAQPSSPQAVPPLPPVRRPVPVPAPPRAWQGQPVQQPVRVPTPAAADYPIVPGMPAQVPAARKPFSFAQRIFGSLFFDEHVSHEVYSDGYATFQALGIVLALFVPAFVYRVLFAANRLTLLEGLDWFYNLLLLPALAAWAAGSVVLWAWGRFIDHSPVRLLGVVRVVGFGLLPLLALPVALIPGLQPWGWLGLAIVTWLTVSHGVSVAYESVDFGVVLVSTGIVGAVLAVVYLMYTMSLAPA